MMNPYKKSPENMRYAVGRIVMGSLIFTSANIVVASAVNDKPASGARRYTIEATFDSSEKRFMFRFEADEGEIVEVRSNHAGMLLIGKLQVHKTSSAKSVQIKTTIKSGVATIARSTLISTLGQPSGILIDTDHGPVALNLLIAELA